MTRRFFLGPLALFLFAHPRPSHAQRNPVISKNDLMALFYAGEKKSGVTVKRVPPRNPSTPRPGAGNNSPAQVEAQPGTRTAFEIEGPRGLSKNEARQAAVEQALNADAGKQTAADQQPVLEQLREVLKRQGMTDDQQKIALRNVTEQIAQLSNQVTPDIAALKHQAAQIITAQQASEQNLGWLSAKVQEVLENPNIRKYLVEVEVNRDPRMVAAEYRAIASANFNVVVLLPEFIDGAPHTPALVDAELEGALADREFKVFDWHFASAKDPVHALVHDVLNNTPRSVMAIGQPFLANTIIAGRVDVKCDKHPDAGGTRWATARATIKVVDSRIGRVLTTLTLPEDEKTEIKGYGRDNEEAAELAIQRMAALVKSKLPTKMLHDFPRYPTTLQFTLTGSGAERSKQIMEIQERLRKVVGSENLKVLSTTDSAYLLSATTPFNRAELAARIEAKTPYRIESISTN